MGLELRCIDSVYKYINLIRQMRRIRYRTVGPNFLCLLNKKYLFLRQIVMYLHQIIRIGKDVIYFQFM